MTQVFAVDAIDRAILGELGRDARITHAALSEKVGLSSTACGRRIKALEEAGIVVGQQAILNAARLGLSTTVVVRISLQSQADESLDAFERAIAACPCVVRCLLMSGADDYLVTVLARDIEDFESIHRRQLSRLPGVARIHSSFAIRDVINRPLPVSALRR